LAFPEDTDYKPIESRQSKGSSIMQLESLALLALLLQLGLGILAIMYATPGFLSLIIFATLLGIVPLSDLATFGYMIAWAILPIAGILQLRAGYKFYKRTPNTITSAKQINILAIVLFGTDTIISAFEGLLLPYPEVALYLAANIFLVYLLSVKKVQDGLNPGVYIQSEYQLYNG